MELRVESPVIPQLKIIKSIPESLNPKAIERAVEQFVAESHVKGDPIGVYQQILESIANSTFLGGNGNFWLAEENGEVVAFMGANFTKDVDSQLCYWVNHAWVAPSHRRISTKIWWNTIKAFARKHFAKHLVIVSSRNPKAYSRYLGEGLQEYATLMMEDI